MKATLWTLGLLLTLLAQGAELKLFEASVRTRPEYTTVEVVPARNAGAASEILEGRYPQGKIVSMRPLASQIGYDWYLARLTVGGANVLDTALAKGSGDARRIFNSRFTEGRIVSLVRLPNTDGYSLFESVIHGATKKVFREVVFATGIGNARTTLQARHPDARISSISEVR